MTDDPPKFSDEARAELRAQILHADADARAALNAFDVAQDAVDKAGSRLRGLIGEYRIRTDEEFK